MTQGIYELKIGDTKYIGKDMEIHRSKRLKEHTRLLENNSHYNIHMQRAFNKYGEIKYDVIIEFDGISREELSVCEMFYIDIFNTYENGFNQTKGGEGGNGLIISEEERRNRSIRYTGENNPLSKLSNDDFFEIVKLLKEGKTNQEIAEQFNLHDRYVSLIRHKKRFKNLWKLVDDYVPEKSNSQKRGLTEDQFIEIVKLIEEGHTNASIERHFDLSAGTGSRIRHKKLYKRWWDKYFPEGEEVI